MEIVDLRRQYHIIKEIRKDLISIRNLFDEKYRECEILKNDIKKGGFATKYRDIELIECKQELELIRIQFDKKRKEFDKKKEEMEYEKILDLRYKEIKQREYEIVGEFNELDKNRIYCEDMENELEEMCSEYEEIKKHACILNNQMDRYDYYNTLYKKTTHCLNKINFLQNEIVEQRNLQELGYSENSKNKEINKNEMKEFFDICETLEDIELEEGILL
jgi:hypothetical protein